MRPAAALIAATLATPAAAEVPRVMTDTPVVHSLVSQVMGSLGSPELLIDRGADPHAFQLRPSQAASLAEADLVFWVGESLTPWLARSLENLADTAGHVALIEAEGVRLREFGEEHDAHGDHGHSHSHDAHHHDDQDVDPHAWLLPENGKAWVSAIAAALSEADPANAAAYGANAEAAILGISAAEAEARTALAGLDRPIVVFHDAYGYFSEAFGVEVAGSIALGDAAAPSAKRLRDLQETVGKGGVACVFQEPQHNGAIARAIAEEAGLGLGTLDPSGTTLDPGAGLYFTLLTDMAREIADCAAR